MLLHQLLAIIVYSGWHYGRVFHDNQRNRIDFQQSFVSVLLILLMSYFLYAKTFLFFAIITSKVIYDLLVSLITPHASLLTQNSKRNMYDALIGLACCIIYIL
jgi:hypothetical protein